MMTLPFTDRFEAGRLLAERIDLPHAGQEAVVLALVRGGVPVGFAVADRLHVPLEVIVVRKIGAPEQPELAVGAVAGETEVLDRSLITALRISMVDLHNATARARAEMKRREELYRGTETVTSYEGRVLILVDDGLATGSTMLAAGRHARTLKPARLMVAVPVGSHDACQLLQNEVDELICLDVPPRFSSVSQWYSEFRQVSDAEVRSLVAESRQRLREYQASAATA